MHRRRITTALLTTTLVAWPMSGAVSATHDHGPVDERLPHDVPAQPRRPGQAELGSQPATHG